jgi:hypothetical protein
MNVDNQETNPYGYDSDEDNTLTLADVALLQRAIIDMEYTGSGDLFIRMRRNTLAEEPVVSFGVGQDNNIVEWTRNCYSRADVWYLCQQHGYTCPDFRANDERLQDEARTLMLGILAEANAAQPVPAPSEYDFITSAVLTEYLPRLTAGVERKCYHPEVRVRYCCDMDGGHYIVEMYGTVDADYSTDKTRIAYLTDRGDIERFLIAPPKRVEVQGEYNATADAYTFPFEGDFIRHANNGEYRGISTGLMAWSLEDIRQQHGQALDAENNVLYILVPPSAQELFNYEQ